MVRVAIFASALIAAAPVTAGQQAGILQPGETLLEVEAQGRVKAVPDQASFSTRVVSDARTARAAMAANAIVARRLVEAVAAAGVTAKDIRTDDLAVGPRFRKGKDGDDTDEITGYRASNRLTIVVRDVGKAASILDLLAQAGANDVSGPNFSFADEEPLKRAAQTKAVAAASAEATDYAAALGMKRRRVLRVSERGTRIDTGSDIVVTASRASAPIMPGEQETVVTVWIDYALTPD